MQRILGQPPFLAVWIERCVHKCVIEFVGFSENTRLPWHPRVIVFQMIKIEIDHAPQINDGIFF